MKKSLLIGLSTTAVTIGIVGLAGIASAATSSTSGTSLVDKIATKFHLSKTDVQAVFDADRTDHVAARTAKQKTKLDADVKTGMITQAQEDALIAKRAELKTSMQALKDKTSTEKHTAMKTQMDNFKQWLTDNKIPDTVAHEHHVGPEGPEGLDGGMPMTN